jgi:hypothetical protein
VIKLFEDLRAQQQKREGEEIQRKREGRCSPFERKDSSLQQQQQQQQQQQKEEREKIEGVEKGGGGIDLSLSRRKDSSSQQQQQKKEEREKIEKDDGHEDISIG